MTFSVEMIVRSHFICGSVHKNYNQQFIKHINVYTHTYTHTQFKKISTNCKIFGDISNTSDFENYIHFKLLQLLSG